MQKQPKNKLVLEFCVELSRRMVVSGANLERVQLAVERICHAYGFSDVSLFLLSNNVSLSAMGAEGRFAARQCTIPPAGIHLDRLKKLNRLSYTVAGEKPEPERLYRLLNEASQVRDYPDWAVLLGQVSIRDYWDSISDADALLGETGMAERRRQQRRRREERDHRGARNAITGRGRNNRRSKNGKTGTDLLLTAEHFATLMFFPDNRPEAYL